MAYIPVLTGEANNLRTEVEGIISGDRPDMLTDRMAELDEATRASGRWVTFGTEIEFEFIDDPTANYLTELNKEDLYEEVVVAAGGARDDDAYRKGEIISPNETRSPVMLNENLRGTYNPDQIEGNISEIRSTPAGALEANDRYWNLLSAIGEVARRNGLMALILSTHINTSIIYEQEPDYSRFIDYGLLEGAEHLAAMQHYLNALRPLQIDSGLETGEVVTEAYPSKDATTSVYANRLEIRHPFVGLADPRIDMLASLAAANQIDSGIPAAAMNNLRPVRTLFYTNGGGALGAALEHVSAYDIATSRFIMPAQLEPTARTDALNTSLNRLTYVATNDAEFDYTANNGKVIRNVFAGLRLVDGAITILPGSPYKPYLQNWVRHMTHVFSPALYRVTPQYSYESPTSHRERRQHIKSSSIVRRVLGDAATACTPADESIARRAAVIDSSMIIT